MESEKIVVPVVQKSKLIMGMVRMMDNRKRLMLEHGNSYRIEEYGSTKSLETPNGIKKYYNIYVSGKSGKMTGAYLSRSVVLNVEKRVEKGLYSYKSKEVEKGSGNPNVKTVFYNQRSCVKNEGRELYGIDINSCYWNTAFIIGAISERVYKLGYKKDREYKDARNVAIGSLGRCKKVEIYDGVKGSKPIVYHELRETYRARIDIIDHVYNVALDIAEKLGDSFCFFLTDCFFVTVEGRELVKQLIKEAGYSCKEESNKLLSIEHNRTNTVAVRWERFNPKEKKSVGCHYFNEKHNLKYILKKRRNEKQE